MTVITDGTTAVCTPSYWCGNVCWKQPILRWKPLELLKIKWVSPDWHFSFMEKCAGRKDVCFSVNFCVCLRHDWSGVAILVVVIVISPDNWQSTWAHTARKHLPLVHEWQAVLIMNGDNANADNERRAWSCWNSNPSNSIYRSCSLLWAPNEKKIKSRASRTVQPTLAMAASGVSDALYNDSIRKRIANKLEPVKHRRK